MSDVWADLNERQHAYLRTLYDCDQATEAGRRVRAARGFYDRTPASVWRWQMYGPVAPPSVLYTALKTARLVDPGTGATWQALEDRGLVRCRSVSDAFGVQLLEVQITPRGRKAVCLGTDEQRPKASPKGQLRERQWAALARLYAAGDEGIDHDTLTYSHGGFNWYLTLRRLEEYKPERLIEQRRHPNKGYGASFYISAFGRDYYAREWARYKALYPNVDAPQPPEGTPTDG